MEQVYSVVNHMTHETAKSAQVGECPTCFLAVCRRAAWSCAVLVAQVLAACGGAPVTPAGPELDAKREAMRTSMGDAATAAANPDQASPDSPSDTPVEVPPAP